VVQLIEDDAAGRIRTENGRQDRSPHRQRNRHRSGVGHHHCRHRHRPRRHRRDRQWAPEDARCSASDRCHGWIRHPRPRRYAYSFRHRRAPARCRRYDASLGAASVLRRDDDAQSRLVPGMAGPHRVFTRGATNRIASGPAASRCGRTNHGPGIAPNDDDLFAAAAGEDRRDRPCGASPRTDRPCAGDHARDDARAHGRRHARRSTEAR
jgi:hypothetical protein